MTLTQRRWTYAGVISVLLLLGALLPGQDKNSPIRYYAAASALVVGSAALRKND